MTALAQDELLRYSRHLMLPDVGVDGQEKLKAARVLLIGAGGLGSPAALYLAAAGVGTIGLVDFDNVDLTNLQRQILHGTKDVGRPKLVSARERIGDVNPHVRLDTYETALTSKNALDIVRKYDLVVDGTDNFATRYLVNDACVLLGKPNVYGSIFRFEGQASVFALEDGPCYRCLFAEPPPPASARSASSTSTPSTSATCSGRFFTARRTSGVRSWHPRKTSSPRSTPRSKSRRSKRRCRRRTH